ncbi:MAG: nuclease A inhibitor family protein [Tepidisphaeraceae bacterium]
MSDLTARLASAVDGLLYPSESDEPFEVIDRPLAKGQTVRQAAHGWFESKSPVIEQPVDEFFAALEGSDDEARFAALRELLEAGLTDLSVFRVGEVQVEVFLLGRAGDRLIGLKTLSVET